MFNQNEISSIYNNIYTSLIGYDQKHLYDFISSIDDWEYNNYISECFTRPKIVDKASPNDLQFVQLNEMIDSLHLDKEKIMLLDYGAGKARLGKCFELNGSDNIVYMAYDPYPPEGIDNSYYYKDKKDIPKNHFDFVIMMNVLHEIDITKWKLTFRYISSLLNENGMLLFVETNRLTMGEQPYCENGYLVLNEPQIIELFRIDDELVSKIITARNSKSHCCLIPRKCLNRVTTDTIHKAIRSLQRESFKKLEEYDKYRHIVLGDNEEPDEIKVRDYAYYSQLYINASLALKNKKMFPNYTFDTIKDFYDID